MQLTSFAGFLSLSADSMNGCKDLLTDTAKLPLSGEADALTMCSIAETKREKDRERDRDVVSMATQQYFFHTSSSLCLAICVHSADNS